VFQVAYSTGDSHAKSTHPQKSQAFALQNKNRDDLEYQPDASSTPKLLT
jgi:hypothetical protein